MAVRQIVMIPRAVTLVVVSFALSGCGPSIGTLSGKVTLDGVPLKGGRIDFTNTAAGGTSSSIEIGEDGSYSLPVLYSGEYTIAVNTEYLKPQSLSSTGPSGGGSANGPPPGMKMGGMPGGMPGMGTKSGSPPGMKAGGPPKDFLEKAEKNQKIPEGYKMSSPADSAKKYVKIPTRYADPASSGLTFKATGTAQTYDIVLTSK